ncbi:MAG: polysaccharide deacetylase family protein [Verrucomicrobia bacterium]|nr:polysaccharide deacetylase family protein [Verrucomicrobiota bacterium]
MNRRSFLAASVTAAATTLTSELVRAESPSSSASPAPSNSWSFWPNGARMAVSLSLMFEAGGQPISGAGGFLAEPIQAGLPDLPTNALFAYGYTEGIPRVLDLMDKHGIKLSSFMIGRAVETNPEIAREIVRRGHEAAAHGRTWENSYHLPPEQERQFIKDCADTIERVTGQRPVGWNAFYLRNSVHTLEILQDLGFLYHIDDPSRDEPFITPIRGKDFVTVPYTFHLNDLVLPPFQGYDPAAYVQTLTDEFDQLYAEAATQRRMMVIAMHDRVSGHAARVRPLDRFLTYARGYKDVWFARKDEIARWALQTRTQTPVVERGPAGLTGLPGPSR